ncbi:hypothetical protein FOBRF1_015983 [Fusarium oxysporum]
MPRIDDLLVLLEVFFAPEKGGLPGGTATKAELDFAEKDSPVKGEDVKPGPWPGGSSPDSVRDDGSAAVAGASFASPLTAPSPGFASPLRVLPNRLRLPFDGAISSASPRLTSYTSPLRVLCRLRSDLTKSQSSPGFASPLRALSHHLSHQFRLV